MLLRFEFPPNYDAIIKVFDLTPYKPIFAFAPFIYNPHKVAFGPELEAHESVHIERQGSDPEGWWERYLVDDTFRLAEELASHVAEYYVLIRGRDRNGRRETMRYIVNRLRHPLYGYKPSLPYDRARSFLKMAIKET